MVLTMASFREQFTFEDDTAFQGWHLRGSQLLFRNVSVLIQSVHYLKNSERCWKQKFLQLRISAAFRKFQWYFRFAFHFFETFKKNFNLEPQNSDFQPTLRKVVNSRNLFVQSSNGPKIYTINWYGSNFQKHFSFNENEKMTAET